MREPLEIQTLSEPLLTAIVVAVLSLSGALSAWGIILATRLP